MDRCIVISTPQAQFSALASTESFSQSIGRVKELGFDAVELAIRDPNAIDRRELNGLLRVHSLPVAAIGTGQAYGEEGLSLSDPSREVREKALNRIKDQMDFALELGVPIVIIGLIRGTVKKGADPAKAEERFVESLCACLDYRPEILLAIEPINRYETNLLNDLSSTSALIERLDRPNLKMLVDSFHMNIEEPDISASIRAAAKHITHVHFADSNRWAPGCGHIDFEAIVRTLREIGYQGAISAEILPKPSSSECMLLAIKAFNRLGIHDGRMPGATQNE